MQNKGLDYGAIGNGSSAALISARGSIDWACLPHFNSPAVFARILDERKGGHFALDIRGPSGETPAVSQAYLEHTNILCTRFSSPGMDLELVDFMPRYRKDRGEPACPPEIIRILRLKEGTARLRVEWNPAPGWARSPCRNRNGTRWIKGTTTRGPYESVYLYTSLDRKALLDGRSMELHEDAWFVVSYHQKLPEINGEWVDLEYQRTLTSWRDWCSRTPRYPRWNREIQRSALVLKLLSFQKSGALIAALTTSLPETIGEVRNWDYRFCWIRDASMTVRVLFTLGHRNTARRFLRFILRTVPFKDPKIQIMYGINGEKNLTERSLGWLEGYRNSRPVRVGNGAWNQKQNDIYGVLLDVIHQNFEYFRHDTEDSEDLWTITRTLVKTVIANWKKPDMGIWEFRSQKQHFVFSKVLCWVALDRGSRIAGILGMEEYRQEWDRIALRIREDILERGWKPDLQAFTQSYENRAMDAANLLMASYGFIDARDPRYVSTVHAIRRELQKDGLMYRYRNPDDFGAPASAFTVCTFWMIKALYRIGEREEARQAFEALLKESNHLGLFSEDMDFRTRELLGNFPQGYSHLALIDTALALMEDD